MCCSSRGRGCLDRALFPGSPRVGSATLAFAAAGIEKALSPEKSKSGGELRSAIKDMEHADVRSPERAERRNPRKEPGRQQNPRLLAAQTLFDSMLSDPSVPSDVEAPHGGGNEPASSGVPTNLPAFPCGETPAHVPPCTAPRPQLLCPPNSTASCQPPSFPAPLEHQRPTSSFHPPSATPSAAPPPPVFRALEAD